MDQHSIFYYPYASFQDKQAPLLKVAALYFDKLYILDPHQASHAPMAVTLEIGGEVENNLQLLEKEGVLERISPAQVLGEYEHEIAEAVRVDVKDQAFQSLCRESGRGERWELALEKVPKELQQDKAMQELMGELPRRLIDSETWYLEDRPPFLGGGYRLGSYPLAFGESIMINHALFASFGLTGALPLTDDVFHDKVLAFKIEQVRNNPEIRTNSEMEEILDSPEVMQNLLASSVLGDKHLVLPALSPEVELQEILDYREKHQNELKQARKLLGEMARQIREQPWTSELSKELENKTIPQLSQELQKVKNTRDDWLKVSVQI